MEDVGTGVGYFDCFSRIRFAGDAIARRLAGRGNAGDEDNGSKAGSKEGAGRFCPRNGER